MSFKKKKNKRFDKPKPPIRKDKLMMHLDSIGECIKQTRDCINKATGFSKDEVMCAVDKVGELEGELDILYEVLGSLEDGFYEN